MGSRFRGSGLLARGESGHDPCSVNPAPPPPPGALVGAAQPLPPTPLGTVMAATPSKQTQPVNAAERGLAVVPRRTRVIVVAVAAVMGAVGVVAGSALARTGSRVLTQASQATTGDDTRPGITVQGKGIVFGAPDVLRLDIGVEIRRSTVQGALEASNAAARKVTAALRRNGVAADDIQTSNLSISPDYDYRSSTPRIRGYVVSNHVRAKLRDLGRAGETIQAAATAAGNDTRIDGVSFDLEDDKALLDAARDQAFTDAKSKAERYARLSGRRLGEVASVVETVSNTPLPPVAYDYAAPASRATAVPISPGQQELAVLVTVVYAFA